MTKLHKRNLHQGRYNLADLSKYVPELAIFIKPNPKGESTVNFADESAVKYLNKALLARFYNIKFWDIPKGYLCPPIPGRADYIHCVADLLGYKDELSFRGKKRIRVLDIGVGANCIYPIIGSQSYGWKFVASEIDDRAFKTANLIVELNPNLKSMIKLVKQSDQSAIFQNIIKPTDYFECTLCNPPFHSSPEEATSSNQEKVKNLAKSKKSKTETALNFGGQNTELWCPGGEFAFLKRMINESTQYARQVRWFTSLVSKKDHIKPLISILKKNGIQNPQVIEMKQGQKISRILAWSFMA